MYSHEQLVNAVRAAGRDGRTFSVKDVRKQLGFETRDKKELSRFRRRLRAFEKDVGDQLEKVGNNSYRLKPSAFETGVSEASAAETVVAQKAARDPASGVFETLQSEAEVGAVAVGEPAQPEAVYSVAASETSVAAPLQLSAADVTLREGSATPESAVVAAAVAPSAPQPVPSQPEAIAPPSRAPVIAARVAEEPEVIARPAPAPVVAARVAEQPQVIAPPAIAARVAEKPEVIAPPPPVVAARVVQQPEVIASPAPVIAARVAEQPQVIASPAPAPEVAAPVAEQPALSAAPAQRSATNGAPKPAAAAFAAVQQGAANGAKAQPVVVAASNSGPSAAAVAAPRQTSGHAVNSVQRVRQLATAILSGALAASAAVSGRVRQRSHNLREQLWSCVQAVPSKQHAIARLRGWAEGLRPLSGQVRNHLNALRQRVRRA